ncbi:hypothetical protein [Thermogymnomonas acidicola]|nr:hypothetical protein [Thermogymnomonas acidicola]
MSSVERLNDIEAYTYQRCSAHEALELMTLRGGFTLTPSASPRRSGGL